MKNLVDTVKALNKKDQIVFLAEYYKDALPNIELKHPLSVKIISDPVRIGLKGVLNTDNPNDTYEKIYPLDGDITETEEIFTEHWTGEKHIYYKYKLHKNCKAFFKIIYRTHASSYNAIVLLDLPDNYQNPKCIELNKRLNALNQVRQNLIDQLNQEQNNYLA